MTHKPQKLTHGSKTMGSQTSNAEPLIASTIRDGSRTWTAESIQSVDIVTIAGAVDIMDSDKPERSRRIAPPNMPLEQFDRMLNNEISRRGMWGYFLESNSRAAEKLKPDAIPEAIRPVMNTIRPKFSFPAGVSTESAEVRLDPTIVALYDSAVNILVANQSGFGYTEDAAAAAGLPARTDGKGYGYNANTDVADKRILYALGAQAAFNPNNPIARLTVTATTGQTLDQIQDTYCPLASKLYEGGRSLDPRDSGLTGFIEGRIDSRNHFQPRDGNFGITSPCATPAPVRQAQQR